MEPQQDRRLAPLSASPRPCVSASLPWVLAAVLALSAGAFAADETPCVFDGIERIVAVGDVHGDYEQFLRALRAAEVIDRNDDWAAGKTHLVQTGDVLDRAGESRKAMDLLMKLEKQAAKAGGAVHALIGNHEAMVLLDDWRYVHEGEIAAFGGQDGFRQAMSAKGQYGQWIRRHNTVVQINGIIFVHGGLEPGLNGKSLQEINRSIRQDLAEQNLGGLAMDEYGPLWTRLAATGDADLTADLEAMLKRRQARMMVVGHTVNKRGIVARAGGRLVMIDVGMSAFYGGRPAALVVEKGQLYEATPGARRKLDLSPATNSTTTKAAANSTNTTTEAAANAANFTNRKTAEAATNSADFANFSDPTTLTCLLLMSVGVVRAVRGRC